MSVVKIKNPSPYDRFGIECFIDGNEVPRVRSIDFYVAVDEIPVFEPGDDYGQYTWNKCERI